MVDLNLGGSFVFINPLLLNELRGSRTLKNPHSQMPMMIVPL